MILCATAKYVFKEYGNKVKYFLTINEQNMMTMFNMGGYATDKERYQANHHMLIAQAKAMIRCHELCSAWIAPGTEYHMRLSADKCTA